MRICDREQFGPLLAKVSALAGLLFISLSVGPANAAIPGTLDHFKCYSAAYPKGVERFPGKELTLADQFGPRQMRLRHARMLCNPVDKNEEGILEPTAHLTCYKARENRKGERFQRVDAILDNQFGQQTVTLRRAIAHCVPTNKEGEGPPPPELDGFTCYKARHARGTPKFQKQFVRLVDQFEDKFYDVLGIHTLCAPAAEPPSEVNDPASHLACFKIRQRAPQAKFIRRIVSIDNALESSLLKAKGPRLLCLPTEKIILEKDQDGDGVTPGQGDCDDNNADVYPGNEEVCDGLDNNCDGFIDEVFPEEETSCYTGPDGTQDVGQCSAGTNVCTVGLLTCEEETTPEAEQCDGVDSNCNGVDDATEDAGGGGACDTGLQGACAAGTEVCTGSALECQADNESSPEICDNDIDDDCDGLTDEPSPENIEICNGLDDNCDAQIDEDNPGGGESCEADALGACAAGTTFCDGVNGVQCAPSEPAPSDTTCDGVDDNCDGTADEGYVAGGACNTGMQGACAAGSLSCEGGSESCNQEVFSEPETCDNIDNDCDGMVDEGINQSCYNGPPETEGVGACMGGTQTCSAGTFGICTGEVTPQPEVCSDAIDNDCDGETDELDCLVP